MSSAQFIQSNDECVCIMSSIYMRADARALAWKQTHTHHFGNSCPGRGCLPINLVKKCRAPRIRPPNKAVTTVGQMCTDKCRRHYVYCDKFSILMNAVLIFIRTRNGTGNEVTQLDLTRFLFSTDRIVCRAWPLHKFFLPVWPPTIDIYSCCSLPTYTLDSQPADFDYTSSTFSVPKEKNHRLILRRSFSHHMFTTPCPSSHTKFLISSAVDRPITCAENSNRCLIPSSIQSTSNSHDLLSAQPQWSHTYSDRVHVDIIHKL